VVVAGVSAWRFFSFVGRSTFALEIISFDTMHASKGNLDVLV
jgi:hypothetical protein